MKLKTMLKLSRPWLGATLMAGLFALPQVASAHAVLQKSMPAVNASVNLQSLPHQTLAVVLTFNSRIDAAHSSLSLVGTDGKENVLAVDRKADANVLRGNAAGLKAGHYSLRWQVAASDGHISRGAIPFDVK